MSSEPQRDRYIVGVVALCVVLVQLVVAGMIWQSRKEALAAGRLQARQLALLLAEKTSDAFATADLALLNTKTWLERGPRIAADDPELRQSLQGKIKDLQHVRAFFVIGPDGFIIHDTDYPNTPRVTLEDREYFVVHRLDPGKGLHVGRPLRSRSVDTWFVPVSRRVERDGAFAGVAVAAIEPRFFEEFFRAIDLGPADAVSLFNTDTTFVARFPQVSNLVGKQFPALSLFTHRLSDAPAGTFESDAFEHGRAIIGYHKLASLPLVTSVVLNKDALLRAWRRSAIAWGVVCLLLPLLVALLLAANRRYRIEREVSTLRALRSQKMETLGQMTSGIVHDFKNILAVTGASLQLARKHGADDRYIATGEQALERGERLTAQLLSFVRRQELNFCLENVNALLRSLEPMIRQAAGASVSISLELDPMVPPCRLDRGQFDAAILNLVVNAVHAMPGGQVVISTALSSLRDRRGGLQPGEYVSVRVADNGSGIAAADLKRVFEPFYTTKSHGTGLGLAQVHAFMLNIDGDARIESELGAGTTVELLFPCRPPEKSRATEAHASDVFAPGGAAEPEVLRR